jgi:hypothetical protein
LLAAPFAPPLRPLSLLSLSFCSNATATAPGVPTSTATAAPPVAAVLGEAGEGSTLVATHRPSDGGEGGGEGGGNGPFGSYCGNASYRLIYAKITMAFAPGPGPPHHHARPSHPRSSPAAAARGGLLLRSAPTTKMNVTAVVDKLPLLHCVEEDYTCLHDLPLKFAHFPPIFARELC